MEFFSGLVELVCQHHRLAVTNTEVGIYNPNESNSECALMASGLTTRDSAVFVSAFNRLTGLLKSTLCSIINMEMLFFPLALSGPIAPITVVHLQSKNRKPLKRGEKVPKNEGVLDPSEPSALFLF